MSMKGIMKTTILQEDMSIMNTSILGISTPEAEKGKEVKTGTARIERTIKLM